MDKLHILVMAAGKGTRMKSSLPKVLHKVNGKPVLEYVLDAAAGLNPDIITVVVGHEADNVRETFTGYGAEKGVEIEFVVQEEQRGTGDAVSCTAERYKKREGHLLILSGDTPLLTKELLQTFSSRHMVLGSDLSVLTMELDDPSGYGRVVKDNDNNILKIVEHRDSSDEELLIREVNAGVYLADIDKIFERLGSLGIENTQGEYYLTDLIDIFRNDGLKVSAFSWYDPIDLLGINTRAELAVADKILCIKKIEQLMDDGVTVYDPDNTYIESGVEIGQDTVIYPGVVIRGNSRIGRNCVINHFCRLTDVTIADCTVIDSFTQMEETEIGSDCRIGPFSRLRPDNKIGNNAKVGNFVEMKKTSLGNGSKASHLTYLGDSDIGERVNIGAGTITCNYDGWAKHKTVIGDGAFIGSNTEIVAPVEIGKGAVTGAGTTVVDDIPEDALAVSRTQQKNILGWAAKKRTKIKDKLKKK